MDAKPTTGPGRLGRYDLQIDSAPSPPRRAPRGIRERILGGIILGLPLLITLWIIAWLYSVLEKKVIDPLARLLLWKFKWTTSSAELPSWFETYAAPVLAILLALALFYCLDLLADTQLHRAVGWTLRRVPIISHIYNPVQQIFQSLDRNSEQHQPQRMVLVTFPHPGVKLPAFVTATCRDIETQRTLLAVYVPTTPVPTSGFFLLVPEEEVTELNWNTEQTLQAVMSGGLMSPGEVSFFKASKDKVLHTTESGAPPILSELPRAETNKGEG